MADLVPLSPSALPLTCCHSLTSGPDPAHWESQISYNLSKAGLCLAPCATQGGHEPLLALTSASKVESRLKAVGFQNGAAGQ